MIFIPNTFSLIAMLQIQGQWIDLVGISIIPVLGQNKCTRQLGPIKKTTLTLAETPLFVSKFFSVDFSYTGSLLGAKYKNLGLKCKLSLSAHFEKLVQGLKLGRVQNKGGRLFPSVILLNDRGLPMELFSLSLKQL